ncbi:helix-turn-helix domain-containing protein [[Mannheimia] succiniciproducens]|uniref:HipB protein n=1 Tax=Mannheimia succiniciproducens (strain KCTC 0769BP / MBEL55E) TaxID=221988 RepID=Q65WE1_MANSM|nr:helix-turn-helix transcriptional regulator [[Mannheimia] succiniciproducens]AAU36719.1 HipB protein [[Mannheimia] succiniciproducens MBEL55E]
MNLSSLFSVRLKNERNRLGLTQAEIAKKCGVSREMWGKYERGVALAGSEVLFSLAAIGVDMDYILLGTRKEVFEEITTEALKDMPKADFSDKTGLLVQLFMQCDDNGRAAILSVAQTMAGMANKTGHQNSDSTGGQSFAGDVHGGQFSTGTINNYGEKK